MCIHACTHVYMYVLYMQTFTCTHNIQLPSFAHRCTFIDIVYTHMHTHAFRHKCIHNDVYTHEYMHIHTGTHIFIYTNTHIHLFTNSTTHAKNQDRRAQAHMTHSHSHVKNKHIHTRTFTGCYTFRGHSFYFSASDMDTQLGYLVPSQV